MYIRATAEVEIDADDIYDSDVVELVEYRIKEYKRKAPKYEEAFKTFVEEITNALSEAPVGTCDPIESDRVYVAHTLADEYKLKICRELMEKYSIEKLESFL